MAARPEARTPPEAPAVAPQAPSEAKAEKPGETGKATKASKAAKAEKPKRADTVGKASAPKQEPASRPADATTIPADAPSKGLRVGAAIAAIAAVAAFITVSRQPAPSEDAEVPNGPGQAQPVQATAVAAPLAEPAPPAATPAPTTNAPADPPPPYVLDVATNPPGARVTAGDKVLLAPGQLDLGQLDEPMPLTAEHEGFEPAAATIDRVGFLLEDGAMRRRIELNLTARAAPSVPAPAKAEPEAPQPRPPSASRPRPRQAEKARAPAAAIPRSRNPSRRPAHAPAEPPPSRATPVAQRRPRRRRHCKRDRHV